MSALHFSVSSINFVSVLAFFSEIQIAEKLADSLVVPGRHDDLADRSEIIQQMMHQALPYASKGIFNYFNLRPDFDTVIYDGVFHEYFKPQINEIKEDYITYIGNLCKEEKGFLDALVAFSEISKKHDSICLQAIGF